MRSGPRQIVFLADSELILPGASGSEAVLVQLRERSRAILQTAIETENPGEIRVFCAQESQFGRPLPAQRVALEFLRFAGYDGAIRASQDRWEEVTTDRHQTASTATVWLVLGTGGASHGDTAPLVADERAVHVDYCLGRLLRDGRWPRDKQDLDQGVAAQVGATLGANISRAGTAVNFAPFNGVDFWETREFGVTYFAARWLKNWD